MAGLQKGDPFSILSAILQSAIICEEMLHRLSALVVLVVTLVAPLQAELRYTMRTEVRKIQVTEVASSPFAFLGELLVKMIAPEGPVDARFLVGDKGARVEVSQTTFTVPAGAVVLRPPGGDIVVLNQAERTYWKLSLLGAADILSQLNPQVTSTRTGEVATIAGAKAERLTFDVTMNVPVPPGFQLPADFPTTLNASGEMWVADQVVSASALSGALNPLLSLFGLDKLAPTGLVVRQIVRSPLFASYEVEMVATEIGEEAAQPELFQIPAEYREVPAPQLGLGR
jgi:hypothetical protein